MVRNNHQIDSIDGKDSDNGLEAMISSFGLQEGLGLKQNRVRITAVKGKMDYLALSMEI